MKKLFACAVVTLLAAGTLSADVSVVERRATRLKLQGPKEKPEHTGRGASVKATGSQTLIDNQGLEYFINTDIDFTTSSSASAAASDATYTQAVAATTSAGGTTASTLNDAFDGYNGLCISLDNSFAPCDTSDKNFVVYNQLGPATSECPGTTSGVNRQIVFPVQTSGSLSIQRKVFVPDNDQFARWLNYFTNTGGSTQTVTMITSNNLGSDLDTQIVNTSNSNTTAETTDFWITSFQGYTGNVSTDVRLGHILQGPGAVAPLVGIIFTNGDDNPYWGYTFTLAPGETKIIANFVTGQPSKAAANAKSAEIAGLPVTALQCTTTAEKLEIANFVAGQSIVAVPTLNEIGLGALLAALAGCALVVLRRRRATA